MKKWVIFSIVLMVLIVIVVLGLKEENSPAISDKSSDDFSSIISSSKNSYKIGEEVQEVSTYSIQNQGSNKLVYIIFENSRKTIDRKVFSGTIINLSTFSTSLYPFYLDEEQYLFQIPYYKAEGTYVYTVYVYLCNDIDRNLNTNQCGKKGSSKVKYETIIRDVVPLVVTSNEIVVEGGKIESACKADSDCTKVCETCVSGLHLCELYKEKCIECAWDDHCKQGYTCSKNHCILA